MSTTREAPAGYRLGDPIPLHDFLSLPPDGRRYARDEAGRLALMSPENAEFHGYPLTSVVRLLYRSLDDPWRILHERGIAFDPIYDRLGNEVPPSRLGRKALECDVAVYGGRPLVVPCREGSPDPTLFSPRGIALVVEVLSPSTADDDLGHGEADRVDRWRTYLQAGVPEYWIVNAFRRDDLLLPAHSGLFLHNTGERFEPLPGHDLDHHPGSFRGLRPVRAGRIESASLPLTLDLDALWAEIDAIETES